MYAVTPSRQKSLRQKDSVKIVAAKSLLRQLHIAQTNA